MKSKNQEQRQIAVIEPVSKATVKKAKRVCAYCRVSTDMSSQLNSFQSQKQYYEKLISKRDGWILVDIYADYGKSGTTECNRVELDRMLRDCELGKIDLIITKSITRFARNTVDCIKEIRMLKKLGVDIYFEKENINTLSEKSELLLTILSSVAQAESESISTNERWSIQKSFLNGTYRLRKAAYGYKANEEREPVISEPEAAVVRLIFESFLNGKGTHTIAKELTEQHILTRTGKTVWTAHVIWDILRNRVYCGDMLYQKYYNMPMIPYKQKRNDGILPQVLVENNHEPIISRNQFERVQEILEYRDKAKESKTVRYEFSGKIVCGGCGGTMRRHKLLRKRTGNYDIIQWCCKQHVEDSAVCEIKPIKEELIQEKFVRMWNKLSTNCDRILEPMLESFERMRRGETEGAAIKELEKRILECNRQSRFLNQLVRQEYIDSAFYMEQQNILQMQI